VIASLVRGIKRAHLKSHIAGRERDVEALNQHRRHDDHLRAIYINELATARRQLQAMAQDDIHHIARANVRKIGAK
jgi:hypothetical protein